MKISAYHKKFQSTPPMQGATRRSLSQIIRRIWFQSTPPMQGATLSALTEAMSSLRFNPRPLCRERRSGLPESVDQRFLVSIHAPYAGSDPAVAESELFKRVSIHAPYAGSDRTVRRGVLDGCMFQSTPPMQGATTEDQDGQMTLKVSIHAPYAGSD